MRSLLVLAVSVLPLAAQEMEDIHGAKPLVEIPAPEPPAPWWVWAAIAFAFLVIAALVWWLRRDKSEQASAEKLARRELTRLQRDGDKLSATAFAEAASGVLRKFIEARFGLAAPKRTTEEFLQEATRGNHALAARADTLREFLRACDYAKFAEGDLDHAQRDHLVSKALAFVEQPVEKEAAA